MQPRAARALLLTEGQVRLAYCLSHRNRDNLPPMPKDYVCGLCDQIERRCSCIKYCWLCRSQFDVRLCEDGQYYCRPCRESCDMQAQYQQQSN
jgi:hypothetical protein